MLGAGQLPEGSGQQEGDCQNHDGIKQPDVLYGLHFPGHSGSLPLQGLDVVLLQGQGPLTVCLVPGLFLLVLGFLVPVPHIIMGHVFCSPSVLLG